MGCSHSMPPPSEDTFAVVHTMKCMLSRDFKVANGHSFSVTQNAWKRKQEEEHVAVDSLEGIQFVRVDNTKCLVQTNGGKVLAVMIASGQRSNKKIEIFGLEPIDSDHKKPSSIKHDGKPLFEHALVKIHFHKGSITSQFDLKTPTDGTYVTDYYGKSMSSKRQMVLTIGKEKTVVASFEEGEASKKKRDFRDPWQCRTCPGIDSILIACMVVAIDQLKDMFHEELRVNSSKEMKMFTGDHRESGKFIRIY